MARIRSTTRWRRELTLAIEAWQEFLRTDGIREATEVVKYYGWLAPILGILAHVFVRACAVYIAEPIVINRGYIFSGWLSAFILNLLYILFLVLLTWFFYFGTIGAVAGLLSSNRSMDTAVFKAGGYLSVLFIPIFVIAFILTLTISGTDTGALAIGGNNVSVVASEIMDARIRIRNTPQMRFIHMLHVVGWAITGLLLYPIVVKLYGLSRLRSVLAVMPTTCATILFTLLT